MSKKADPDIPLEEAKPVTYNGVVYTPDFIRTDSGQMAGGYISATEEKSGLPIWDKFVYTLQYDSTFGTLEEEVLITQLFMEGDRLIAIDSLGNRYELNPINGERLEPLKKK